MPITPVTRMAVTITGFSADAGRVMCRDTWGQEFEIDATLRPKGTGLPAEGERWVLLKVGNMWALEYQVGASTSFPIVGDTTDLHPVAAQLLEAMAAHGLVQDFTTKPPLPPPPDESSDPRAYDPEEEYADEDEGGPREHEDPNDDRAPASALSSDVFSVVTFNVLYKLGPARARQDIMRVISQADLVALQECGGSQRGTVLAQRPEHWNMHRTTGNTGGNYSPILWNSRVFKREDSGTKDLSPWDGPGTKRPPRSANWVKLTHRATGVTFTFVNVHLENAAARPGFLDPNFKPGSPRHIERFRQQMDGMVPLLRELSKSGPVLMAGDYNVSFPADLNRRDPALPTAAFGRVGMRSNWDLMGLPKIPTTLGGGIIDGFFLRNKIEGQMKFTNDKVLRGYNSDHRPVLAKVRIKTFS